MVQFLPTVATFANGEGLQPSASFYIHGSIDGGEDVYSVGGAAAVWDGADGGIGIDSPDTAVSFAGHENDAAGTGGPYSPRLACLLLRPQLAAAEDYEVELDFQFRGTAKGERVAVFARIIPDTFTSWETRGVNGARKPHFFEKAIQGIGLEVDDGGNAILFSYGATGARTNIATASVTVGTSAHNLTLLISGSQGATITPEMDGASMFAASTYAIAAGLADTRGHAAFALTRTIATDYPLVTAFQVRDFNLPLSPAVVLRDEWTRTPELEGTIVPTASVPNNIDLCPHRVFEWGGNRIAAIAAEPMGPWLSKGTRRYGPETTASPVTSTDVLEWLDIYMAGAATATQVANLEWEYSLLSGPMGGFTSIGVAARATKSAIDPGVTPTLANATAYIFRLVFITPLAYFELVRIVAGTEVRLEQTRPVNVSNFQLGQIHKLSLQVEDAAGDPVLNATWTDNLGIVHLIYTDLTDSDASKITAAGSLGIYAKLWMLNGGNPTFDIHSLSITGTSTPPPTLTAETEVFGVVPFAPEFAERAQDVYRTIQRGTDRFYVYSHREFIEPRTFFTASWLLPNADAATMYEYLLARNKDRLAMTITIDGTARNLIATSSDFDISRDAGGFQRIGPVAMMEVL